MPALIGRNVRIYGNVILGEGVIVEDDVTIGHPSAIEVAAARSGIALYPDVDAFYRNIQTTRTVLGNDCTIRSGTVIYSGVRIGHRFECGHHVIIREGTCLGDDVYLKSHSHIMRSVVIGDSCRISAVVADQSTIGNRVSVFGTLTHRTPKRSPSDAGPWIGPTVGDDCLVGRGAVVLGPCEIGAGAIIGANAFVDSDVPSAALIVAPRGVDHRFRRKDVD